MVSEPDTMTTSAIEKTLLSATVSQRAKRPLPTPSDSKIRTPRERELIAHGRFLLQAYQSKLRERVQMDTAELASSDYVVEMNGKSHQANGNTHPMPGSVAMLQKSNISNSVVSSCAILGAPNSSIATASPASFVDWSAFLTVISHNAELLDSMEQQLYKLWDVLKDEMSTKKQFLAPLRHSIMNLLQQKRLAQAQIDTTTAAMGPPISLPPVTRTLSQEEVDKEQDPITDHGENISERTKPGETIPEGSTLMTWMSSSQFQLVVQRETEKLQHELDQANARIGALTTQLNAYKVQLAAVTSKNHPSPPSSQDSSVSNTVSNNTHEIRRLQNVVQEKEQLLCSLRTSVEQVVQDHQLLHQDLKKSQTQVEILEREKRQMEKAAMDKRTLWKRAYHVKAKQLDQLCQHVALPSSWGCVTDENGIMYYRQTDRACAPELNDPRVPIVWKQLTGSSDMQKSNPVTVSNPPSPRSAAGRIEFEGAHHKEDRKASSSFDSTVSCEDIAIPADDGMDHQVQDFESPLPHGWEMRVTTSGSVFFVNRVTNVTTWQDPRRLKTNNSAPAKPLRVDIPSHFKNDARRFDVVFHEKGPIGIHFQANVPDAGAIVRRLLPQMAADRTQKIQPYDCLIAVNQNPVNTAPFRHVMLLLQGGLRPLTLTFERLPMDSDRATTFDAQAVHSSDCLDEEVLEEENHLEDNSSPTPLRRWSTGSMGRIPNNDPSEDPSSRRRSSRVSSSSSEVEDTLTDSDDYSFADRLLTNLFSLFWTPPESFQGQVETV